MISPRRTWQGSVRVSAFRLEHCRKRALEEGWDLSDFARMLICLGATSYFLRLRKPEACERFKLLARMSGASKALDVAARGRSRSPRHEAKHIGETTLLPMHLPRGLYDMVSTCFATVGRSTNATLSLFLESGFLMYALGQNTLLETLRSFQEERRVRGLRTSA